MNAIKLFKVVVILILLPESVVTLKCYDCQNIDNPKMCNVTVTCQSGQACYQTSGLNSASKSVSISMGCVTETQCSGKSVGPDTLVGRSLTKRQDTGCHKCCTTDLCNYNLCFDQNHYFSINQQVLGMKCVDVVYVDCQKMDATLGICRDKEHASILCPKFCGLCEKVDGVWADWSSWSTCSVSCGIGIQRRQRNCSNPSPNIHRDFCVGLNLDDRLCKPGACYDGGWSNWGSWTSCSVTCGDGFHSRSRNCSNPSPSPFGRYCDGEPVQVSPCKLDKCEVSEGSNAYVMFRSRGFTTMGFKVDNGTVFVYTTTTINEGHGYNGTSGIFTAPLGGFYSFSVQICSPTSHRGAYGIFVNGVNIKPSYYGNNGIILSHTTNAVAILKKGDRVWTQCIVRTCYLRGDGDVYWNTFSGYLIHQ